MKSGDFQEGTVLLNLIISVSNLGLFVGSLYWVLIGVILPHELGHFLVAKYFRFSVRYFEVIGFRFYWVKGKLKVGYVPARQFAGMVLTGKLDPTVSEIRWILLAGSLANLTCATLLIPTLWLQGI